MPSSGSSSVSSWTSWPGLLGVAVGALLRNTTAAVGATLVWASIVEGIVPAVTNQPHLDNWLPSGAIREVASSHTAPGPLVPIAAAALLLAYAARHCSPQP
ncbi:MAG TPA: hypothetical protein VGJ59_20720 [Jatrophihabitantaceae bacterium]